MKFLIFVLTRMHPLREYLLWTFFRYCDLDLDPITFMYELDPCCVCNCLREVFRKLSSERHTCRQTDRQTGSTEIIKHAASRVLKDVWLC